MPTKSKSKFSVGDEIQFEFGTSFLRGVIVEDRGPIGVDKTRIFGIRVHRDPDDDVVFEMPEDELEALDPAAAQLARITENEAAEYFERGGLTRILRAGLSGGKTQSHVWLLRDSLGNVTHTFSPQSGGVGGAIIPFYALHDNRVFTPKRDEVLSFLTTFGLSTENAERVLDNVGMAP